MMHVAALAFLWLAITAVLITAYTALRAHFEDEWQHERDMRRLGECSRRAREER